ncbi:MAG: hypothetical protein L6R42_000270 [Xanthoria sp. 1 TBL-2021]|nr:MAG: hypothetical protein L6R42_000270 [Xanthoria sp. 1 TBL-2021]
MAPPVTFDMQRLRQQHDMSDPQSLSKFQCTVYDFVQMARTNIDVSEDHLREFCNLVAHKETWPLAQTMVPEFHSVRKESAPKAVGDGGSQSGTGSFKRILDRLDHLGRLPLPVSDRNALTGEYKLLDQRHLRLVEAITTRGDGRAAGMPPIQEAQARHEIIMAATDPELWRRCSYRENRSSERLLGTLMFDERLVKLMNQSTSTQHVVL